ncbi:hypothetical protein phiAS5_ORF0226 [Aeromonas phage phiAS5]|uniref:Uncharacterized protein n=1 Tax=Aeromonas phage phiAS5 TaxID=879630 RepID=E1A1Y0_9CAUD|nr:hypothetical protein phiAS5_ORF0226 [Aeromonas phage phiAS5]ADM80069.1 hypothetical protein phiAS5_ORF0226 [Aeromonas phage phiAS5]BES53165.1 hypothetical protein [Aeromonas phage phiWae14]
MKLKFIPVVLLALSSQANAFVNTCHVVSKIDKENRMMISYAKTSNDEGIMVTSYSVSPFGDHSQPTSFFKMSKQEIESKTGDVQIENKFMRVEIDSLDYIRFVGCVKELK